MKKPLLKIMAVLMALVIFQLQTMAGSTVSMSSEDEAIVNFDETEIYSSFDEINDLSTYLATNDVTYSDVESYNNSLVDNVSSSAALALGANSAKEPPYISAFLWGCVLNWVGIVVVALTSDMDMGYIMKSVWGCVASTAFWVAFSLILSLIGVGGFWAWYL